MAALTEDQKEQKAKNIIKGLALDSVLKNLKATIAALFKDAPIGIADTVSKEELEALITKINAGTSDNNTIARFLELANSLGL